MRPQEKPGCRDLHPESVDGLNMLIEKDLGFLGKVLVHAKDSINRCLGCPERDLGCQKGEANYIFLEANDKQNEGKREK